MAQTGKKKRKRPEKPAIEMTNDELIDRVFNQQVRKKLKKLAQENQPDPKKTQANHP